MLQKTGETRIDVHHALDNVKWSSITMVMMFWLEMEKQQFNI